MLRPLLVAALAVLTATACAAAGTAEPTVPHGFSIEKIASVRDARELAMAPSGDLFVGSGGSEVYIVARADARQPDPPRIFARIDDAPVAGVALSDNALFVGGQFGVYRIPYHAGDVHASSAPEKLAAVRTSGISRDHQTTSLAWNGRALYASVGSSCNGCKPELDATRATIQRVNVATHRLTPIALHIRNAIALAIRPRTGALWAGVAGIDDLQPGHPYEIFDDVTSHHLPVDYGWPTCYENRKVHPKWPGDCSHTPIPRVVFPAYETPIGAVFYPGNPHGRYAFPASYRGGAFVTLHGSWHDFGGLVPPRVVFVPFRNGSPIHPVNWSNPDAQWSQFVAGYQSGPTDRIGRPTGITVGPDGSLFVADDLSGAIYRIRPR
ncbi:MAG TPA: hypothetical protein VFN49_12585 [Candidatus Aquilonibacter sp.]|nr:hypothetical protein [Candidatus Aquilonibacter sp.]